ncbi:uncharacterized protein LOC130969749 isoform X2 [Arachis stenosperma]|uniref:uncharacterized protein LOC130969749 isoform X2 n=1 Tax=Arachis stenosperma TaxID=217475 RepID=UPI0025ACB6A6|nr:uncharacterized protein LOC130969749 isoform X2 [Arachis stenosperma]
MAKGSESVGEGGTERDERSTEAHGSQPGESGSRAAEYSVSLKPFHPLQNASSSRAHSLLTLANITSTLFSLKLRCKGTIPDYHPLKSELDRLKVYQRKLEPFGDVGQALPLPSSSWMIRLLLTTLYVTSLQYKEKKWLT